MAVVGFGVSLDDRGGEEPGQPALQATVLRI